MLWSACWVLRSTFGPTFTAQPPPPAKTSSTAPPRLRRCCSPISPYWRRWDYGHYSARNKRGRLRASASSALPDSLSKFRVFECLAVCLRGLGRLVELFERPAQMIVHLRGLG